MLKASSQICLAACWCILTAASGSHTYLSFSKERKTLRLFSPYLHLPSLFPSEVTLGAVLMFLRAEVPNSPCCLMMFKYVFNKQLQAFCLNSFPVYWFAGHLPILSWRAEGPHTCCLKTCYSIPTHESCLLKVTWEISANACLLLQLCLQRQRLQCGSCFLRNCQFDLRTKSKNI